MAARTLAPVAMTLLGLSCAPSVPAAYAERAAAAERAYVHGRYLEAAARWGDAASAAGSASDAHEARYRRAVSLARGGRLDEARDALGAVVAAAGSRSPRALYDLALLSAAGGDEPTATTHLDTLIGRYPRSGLASPAILHRIGSLRERDGEGAVSSYLRELEPRVAGTPIAERIGYELARSLERDGDLPGAAVQFRRIAEAFPYPAGALWDDAVFRGAMLEARLGAPERAIAQLQEMLEHRETATVAGSYERPRYAEARFAIAELYRDAIADPAAARREFLALWSSHPTSLLRDDAKWQAALLAARGGDTDAACEDMRQLANGAPDSRYLACATVVCPSAAAPTTECRSYIRREADAALARQEGPPRD